MGDGRYLLYLMQTKLKRYYNINSFQPEQMFAKHLFWLYNKVKYSIGYIQKRSPLLRRPFVRGCI